MRFGLSWALLQQLSDTWVTVILWQHYYIKMHTDSVTYVNANSRPSFSSSFIVQTLSFMHCTCNFICGLSDVIIKTLSQLVTDRKVRGADMLACLVWSCSCWTDHRQVLQLFVITVVISVLEKKILISLEISYIVCIVYVCIPMKYTIFTTRCYASAVLAVGLCLSVCHKSEFY